MDSNHTRAVMTAGRVGCCLPRSRVAQRRRTSRAKSTHGTTTVCAGVAGPVPQAFLAAALIV